MSNPDPPRPARKSRSPETEAAEGLKRKKPAPSKSAKSVITEADYKTIVAQQIVYMLLGGLRQLRKVEHPIIDSDDLDDVINTFEKQALRLSKLIDEKIEVID